MKTFHPSYIRLNHFFLSSFLSFFLSFCGENIPCNGRWFPPCHRCRCDLNSERFAEFYFWFLRRSALITAPGRMSAININTRVSLSFFSHARSIFQWSLSHLLRFLLSCSISEQVSGSPYSSLYFLPESERNSIIFLVRRLLYVRSDISIWKMEEIVEKRKKHSSFQIVLEFFENYTIYILRNKEILQLKWNFYPYFSIAYRCHVLKCKSVKWKMSVARRVTITSPYKLEIGD